MIRRLVALLLQGNEQEETRQAYLAVMERVAGRGGSPEQESAVRFQAFSLGGARSHLREYAVVFLIMTAALLGGMVVGFNMVDDRQTRAVQALAVSPLPLRDYLVSRAVFALLLLAFLASAAVAVIVVFVTALTADNQIAAIGSVKIIMPAYLLVPLWLRFSFRCAGSGCFFRFPTTGCP